MDVEITGLHLTKPTFFSVWQSQNTLQTEKHKHLEFKIQAQSPVPKAEKRETEREDKVESKQGKKETQWALWTEHHTNRYTGFFSVVMQRLEAGRKVGHRTAVLHRQEGRREREKYRERRKKKQEGRGQHAHGKYPSTHALLADRLADSLAD